jgi:polysaccharide biosynthesis protein PelA
VVVVALAACALASTSRARAAETPRMATAFYYGSHVPPELLDHFDRIVVEPDNLKAPPAGGRARPFAYVSVGEVHPSRPWRKELPASLVLFHDARWGADVVDTRKPAWRSFLIERVIEPLYALGYRGLFLDTLDSHRLVAAGEDERRAHVAGIAAIVAEIRRRHPDVQILMNRGFDVLPLLERPPEGLVAESLFRTAGPDGVYREVPPAESDQLRRLLLEARARWGLPITVIDYVPPTDPPLRRATARLIWDAGFDPYVSTPALDGIGVGRAEIVPRRVLLLYKNHPEEGYLGAQDACVLVAPILEWMGYAVDYVDVDGPLPEAALLGRYAGVVTLVTRGDGDEARIRGWLFRCLDAGLRVAFLEGFGFEPDAAFLTRLGLVEASPVAQRPVRIASTSAYVGFEAAPRALARDLPAVRRAEGATRSLLTLVDAGGATWDPIVIGPWGGAALAPYVIEDGLDQERRWILDPFRFLSDALALPSIPAPDVTTESGRRILTVAIDGDAFVSRAERPDRAFAGKVILDEILSRYRIPHTVSVIEGEVGPAGLYPADSPRLEAIARDIFRLPYVEAGSHTFSHPFDWAAAESGRPSASSSLPIPNYTFDMNRDLRGSIEYIQSRLLPAGKSVRVLQWSGDCSPSAAAVAFVQRLGVENVNGGGSTRTEDFPSLTRGSAMGIPKAEGVYQVFAPVENENVFTNEWRGPYYGYEHVIETFALNESPRRLSPISMYYHFYSGVKTASLAALAAVYEWALAQETTRLFLSEYAARVRAFQSVTLARRVDDGAWELDGLGDLRTVRVDPAWGWPDLARSVGVAGVRDTTQGRYVHLAREAQDGEVVLVPSSDAPATPYLQAANGRVLRWSGHGDGRRSVRLAAHEPIVLDVAGAHECTLTTAHETALGRATVSTERSLERSIVRLKLDAQETGDATLDCR